MYRSLDVYVPLVTECLVKSGTRHSARGTQSPWHSTKSETPLSSTSTVQASVETGSIDQAYCSVLFWSLGQQLETCTEVYTLTASNRLV